DCPTHSPERWRRARARPPGSSDDAPALARPRVAVALYLGGLPRFRRLTLDARWGAFVTSPDSRARGPPEWCATSPRHSVRIPTTFPGKENTHGTGHAVLP